MINIYWLRPQVGDALWLFYLLNAHMKYVAENEWLPVADGKGKPNLGSTAIH